MSKNELEQERRVGRTTTTITLTKAWKNHSTKQNQTKEKQFKKTTQETPTKP